MNRSLRALPLILAGLLAAPAAALAQEAVESSASLRERAKAMRGAATEGFARTEAACYDRFFVNACLDEAREARTVQMQAARKLEARANRIDRGERIKAMEARLRLADERRSAAQPDPILPLPESR